MKGRDYMSKEKIVKIKYVTKEKLKEVNPSNLKKYEKYRKSNILKNKDVEKTTYKVYKSYFYQFLVYLMEEWDNIDLYSDEFMEEAVDIMEGFMALCQDKLKNHKKIINTKISAISSFYLWSFKRRLISKHPFDRILDRIKGAGDEKILNDYFLSDEQLMKIRRNLNEDDTFELQDRILFELSIDSANRLSAIHGTELGKLNLEGGYFENIREKRGKIVEVVFSENTGELIQEWLEMRKEGYDNMSINYLFVTKYHGEYQHMSKSTMQERMKKIVAAIGIEDFHFHCLRKTSINKIVNDTGDISLAAEFANHNDIGTTSKHYVKPKSKTEIRDKIKKMRENKE